MFVLESQLPPLTAIPGIKPGAFQYFYTLHHGNARPRLGFRAVFDARHARLRYHRAGLGIFIQLRGRALRVCAPCFCSGADSGETCSGFGAYCAPWRTNTGQLAAAAAIAKTGAVWSYLPVLIPAAILAGTLTGLCAQLVLNRLAKAGVLPKETGSKKQEEEANG